MESLELDKATVGDSAASSPQGVDEEQVDFARAA